MSAAAAKHVIAAYRDRSVNYGEVALFDHLPMTVWALAEMGASESRLRAWAATYAAAHGLRPAGAAERAGRERWRARIAERGGPQTLAAAAERLADGIGAAAFHAAIRAAYALERCDDDDLAAALEAWEREYLALPPPPAASSVPVAAALAALAAEPVAVDAGGLIVTRMAAVARQPRFAAVAAVVPEAAAIDTLAVAAAAAFARSGNFTALHVMTGTHAMRAIAPHLRDAAAAMPGFWRAFAAASLTSGAVAQLDASELAALRSAAPADWEPLLHAACEHDDEHVIKSTYTAWRLDRDLDDGVFRTAAQRYVQRLARASG